MTTAHEPTIHYLDSVLNEEEKRCDYSHQWRNFTISRSGRFRSKNKKRDVVDGKLFDAHSGGAATKENEKVRPFSNSHLLSPGSSLLEARCFISAVIL
ncbi:GL22355 [Drosophila persimilis]|uniref:GL22355 n=1 Tax=Drosophila persimilis TaxID=7234 RepID=B4GDY5_DROPE|nr:GL22355 [Drosophila persimilis]